MAAVEHITGFGHGETVSFPFFAKKQGKTLPSADTASVLMNIASEDGDIAVLTFSTQTGHITLSDLDTAQFIVLIPPADLNLLTEGKVYHYNIWTTQGSEKLWQATGRFLLRNTIQVGV